MGRARLTTLLRLCLVGCLWAATAGEVARAHVGVSLADVRRPSASRSIGAGSAAQGLLEAPCGLPTLCETGSGPRAPFACPWHALAGRLSALEQRLFADAADGRWDEHSLLAAALVASGLADPDAVRRYEEQVARLAAELAESGKMTGPAQEKAATLFEFMHRSVLRSGYQIDATVLTRTLDEGRFNCVSASVLFNCLAAEFELSARGLETPGHAMSRLTLPDGPLDVETTCPGWFRLIGDPDKQAELVEKTLGRRAAESAASAKPREVSDVELVATIYYNRGVDLLAAKRFAEAVAANAKSLRLDPSNTTARGNLLATINNWAVDLDLAGRPAEAIELLRRGLALDRDYETFKVNYVHAHSQWIEALCAADRFREALDVIARAAQDQVEEAYFQRARVDVYRRWALPAFQSGDYAEAIRRTTYQATPGQIHEALVNNIRYGYHQWISQLIVAGRRLEARRIARRAMADPFLAGQLDGALPPSLGK